MIVGNGIYIYSEDSAIEWLKSVGLDKFDIEELREYLCGEEIEDAKNGESVWKQEYNASEAMNEEYYSAIVEAMNIADEALAMQRISKPRERFESIVNVLKNV